MYAIIAPPKSGKTTFVASHPEFVDLDADEDVADLHQRMFKRFGFNWFGAPNAESAWLLTIGALAHTLADRYSERLVLCSDTVLRKWCVAMVVPPTKILWTYNSCSMDHSGRFYRDYPHAAQTRDWYGSYAIRARDKCKYMTPRFVYPSFDSFATALIPSTITQ